MDKDYIKIVSTIHTGYNGYNGLLGEYEFTIFVLSTILFRKLGCVKLADSEHIFDSSKIKNNDAFNFFITKYEKRLHYLDVVDDVIDEEGVPLYDVTELTAYILKLDQKLFDNYYGQMVEECLSIFFSKYHSTIQDSLQPQELNQLINYFLPEDKNISVYNPFAGMCSLGMNLSDNTSYLAEEINFEVAKLAELRFLISDKKNFKIKNTDSIKSLNEPFNDKYDFIVSTPPFGLKGKDALERIVMESNEHKISLNSFIIDASCSKLKENGKLVFTISENVLYSGIKGNKEFRRNLVVNSQIETLIKLPNRLFKSTGISSYIIVLGKDRKKNASIRMIDASEMILDVKSKQNILDLEKLFDALNNSFDNDNCVFVNKEEIINNDYNLSVNRYLVEDLNLTKQELSRLESLNNIVTIVKRQRIYEEKGKLIRISDLSKDKLDYTKTFEDLEERDLKNHPNLLKQDALLLSSVQSDLKPTVFLKTDSEIYYPHNFIMACIVDSTKVNLDYLVLELHKEYITNQIKTKRIGVAIQKVSRKDLLEIKIVLPNIEEQLKKVNIYRSLIISEKQEDFKKLIKNYGIDIADENSFLRHQIAGTLKNVRGTVNALKQIISSHPEILEFKRDERLDSTLEDYMSILDRDISNIHKAVLSAGKEIALTEIILKRFDLISFLISYVKELKNRKSNLFQVFLNLDKDLLDDNNLKTIFINGDKDFLRRAFDNVIDNAVKHGFQNRIDEKNIIDIDLTYDFENLKVQIGFGNTGKSLPKDFTIEEYVRKGHSKGPNAGDGIGGWFINEVMKKHKGALNFVDENGPYEMFVARVTTFELSFPINIKV
jgi:type I restriction enzyme M protein